MPVYEFKCLICNIQYEEKREMGDTTLAPMCCGMRMERVWSAPAVKFNAPGFYSTGG